MKQKTYLFIAQKLVKEFITIYGESVAAQMLVQKGCSYDDLIALGINTDEAMDALIKPVEPIEEEDD